MPLPELISSLVAFAYLVANLLVFVLTITTYQSMHKCYFLLLAISSGIGAILVIASWLPGMMGSWTFWSFWNLATISDVILWVIGI